MHWLWPIPVLLTASVLGAVLGLLAWHAARRRRSLLAPWAAAGGESWSAVVLPRRSRGRALALAGTWVLVLVALARPQWGTVGSAADLGGTVVLAIDGSASMRAADVSPSRQALARQWVRELAAQLPGCRLGLIVFAGEAQVLCPPTVDHAIFLDLLAEAAVPSREGSELRPALDLGRKVLERAGGGVLVVVTDGEYHDRDPGAALRGGRRGTLDLLTVTVGGGTPVPVPGPGAGVVVTDPRHGGAALTAAHPEALRVLAGAAGGLAIDSARSATGAAAAVRFIEARLAARAAPTVEVRPAERFQWPVALALVLLVLRLATPEVRCRGAAASASRGSGAPVALLLVLCLVVSGGDGSVASARIEALRAASLQAPGHDRARCLYNLALALQEGGQAAEARRAYAEALALPGAAPQIRARCLNNLGVLDTGEAGEGLARTPDLAATALGRARAALHEALRLDPRLEVASRNLQEAQSLAERLQVRQALAGAETLAHASGAGVAPPPPAATAAPPPLPPRAALPAAGSATASRHGVPVQDGSALERLCQDAGSAREFMQRLTRGRTPERPSAVLPW